MGRSRAVTHSTDEDPSQSRSKRKKTAHNVENIEAATSGQVLNEGKKALYHCNYCNKDISGKVRIKCVMCPDFDLCIECFSIGAEVHPHKSNHPYRVMDNLSFPLICHDWNADEEILLLEGIEMYGLGNWTEVAEHVGTKSKSHCIGHYNGIYMNSPCFPLPEMSHVMGKNREELLAMAREHAELNKGCPTLGEVRVTEEQFSAKIKMEDGKNEGLPASGIGSGGGFIGHNTLMGAGKKAFSIVLNKDGFDDIKVEDSHADRSVGEKKPRTSGDEGPSMKELSGYNSKRQEFEIEYDNDAEQLLADMEFKETDTDAERDLKLRVLRIYSKRLDERKRRKDFILERNLLYPDPFQKDLSSEEKEICCGYRVFMRFHSKEEHEEFLRSVIEEHRILKRIQDLQDARAAGCGTSAEAERYIEQKRRDAEENLQRVKESMQVGTGGKLLQRPTHLKGEHDSSHQGVIREPLVLDSGGKDTSSTTSEHMILNALDKWDVTGFIGADLLTEPEKQLCSEIRILPVHYLSMLQTISVGNLSGNITKRADAYSLFNVDSGKVDKIYDMLVKKGMTKT